MTEVEDGRERRIKKLKAKRYWTWIKKLWKNKIQPIVIISLVRDIKNWCWTAFSVNHWNDDKNGNFNCGCMVIWWMSEMQFWIYFIELCLQSCILYNFSFGCFDSHAIFILFGKLCQKSYVVHQLWLFVSKVMH